MEKRKVKKDKRKKKSPGNVEKLPGKSDSFYSSEDKKNMYRVYGRGKKCSLLENSSKKRPEWLLSGNENNF